MGENSEVFLFEKSEMKRLRRFASTYHVVFFLLIGERHASTAHREGNAGKPELTCKDFYLQKGQGQKTSQ